MALNTHFLGMVHPPTIMKDSAQNPQLLLLDRRKDWLLLRSAMISARGSSWQRGTWA